MLSCDASDENKHTVPADLEKAWELTEFIADDGSETSLIEGEVNTLRFTKREYFWQTSGLQ